eukprot:jgi/Galph1/2187/GphlegSOOS_G840.1
MKTRAGNVPATNQRAEISKEECEPMKNFSREQRRICRHSPVELSASIQNTKGMNMNHTSAVVREALRSAKLHKIEETDSHVLKKRQFVQEPMPFSRSEQRGENNLLLEPGSNDIPGYSVNMRNFLSKEGVGEASEKFNVSTEMPMGSKSLSDSSSSETMDHKKLKKKREHKESIITQTIEYIRWEQQHIAQLRAENRLLREQTEELRSEKNELRSDKNYLKHELHLLKEEVERLRNDNVVLWHSCRKGDAVASDAALDAALRNKLIDDNFEQNDFNNFLRAPLLAKNLENVQETFKGMKKLLYFLRMVEKDQPMETKTVEILELILSVLN